MMNYLFCGMLIGLLFGVPAGAVGAMTVQRTLQYGVKSGLITGLGSSVADCFYACVGVFGLTLISDFLLAYQRGINLFGGGLIFFMGMRLFFQKNNEKQHDIEIVGRKKLFFSSFVVGITNPMAILTFLFAFSYFGISEQTDLVQRILLICGVFIGTYIWWTSLSVGVNTLRKKAKNYDFKNMNRIFGSILISLGLVIVINTVL